MALFPDKFLKSSEEVLSASVKHLEFASHNSIERLPSTSLHSCCSWCGCALIGDGKIQLAA
jgi:hypothetical protein